MLSSMLASVYNQINRGIGTQLCQIPAFLTIFSVALSLASDLLAQVMQCPPYHFCVGEVQFSQFLQQGEELAEVWLLYHQHHGQLVVGGWGQTRRGNATVHLTLGSASTNGHEHKLQK